MYGIFDVTKSTDVVEYTHGLCNHHAWLLKQAQLHYFDFSIICKIRVDHDLYGSQDFLKFRFLFFDKKFGSNISWRNDIHRNLLGAKYF